MKPGTKAWLERPFDRECWSKAQLIADAYRFEVVHDPEEPWFYAFGVEAKGAMGGGETLEACYLDIRLSMREWVASMLEEGKSVPQPIQQADEKRSSQVNVRLTADEKFRIEEAAKRAGFRGVSDFVRFAALERT